MKKFRRVLAVVFLMILLLTGCETHRTIEQTVWRMEVVQSMSDGSVVAVSPDSLWRESYPEAVAMRLDCRFEFPESFTIENGGRQWTGTFQESKESSSGEIYELRFHNGKEAFATRGLTEYAEGLQKDTLVITGQEFALYFFAAG